MPLSNNFVNAQDPLKIFEGGGEMGALMRAYNWDAHPLGNPAQWPHSLKNNIRLLLNSGFPMFLWWSDELYAFHNDAYLPALGNKHPKALGESARKVWAEIWDAVGGIAENIMQGGEPFYVEGMRLLLERKSYSEETYWTFSYSPAFDDQGEIAGIYCACYEMTSTILGQRRMKSLNVVSEAMSQIYTIKQACQSVCTILANNNLNDIPFSFIYLIDVTGAEATLLGHGGESPTEHIPEVVNLANPQTKEEFFLAKVQRTKQSAFFEGAPYYNSSGVLSNKAVAVPIFRPGQDQILGIFISGLNPQLEYDGDYQNFHRLLAAQVATSVASVQTREEARRRQEDLLDLFQQAPVAICVLRGKDYVVELANQGMCELWGKTLEQVENRPVFDGVPEARDQGLDNLLNEVVRTGEAFVANGLPVMLNRGGQVKPVYINLVYHPLRNAHGLITGVIAVALDVSVQVEAQNEVESVNRELRAINSDLDNFVYSASHDLKAPISNIEGLVNALLEDLAPETLASADVSRVLTMIQTSINRFKKTVADLSEVGKIQRVDKEELVNVNLEEVVAKVEMDFASSVEKENATVITDFSSNAPVHFSANNARSIVYNLFSNALKYRALHRAPVIKISTEATAEHVILTISDNGLGIQEKDLPKIFFMFKRLHDHVEGTGVGLYIVKRIVENSGGKIEVESEPQVGTTFKIFFKR